MNFAMMILINLFCYYEYMDSWEKFDETSLSPKEDFYSELNLEGVSDEDYAHGQKVWEVLKINNFGEYHDQYFKVIHYQLQMFLENLETNALKYTDLILLTSYLHLDQHGKPA